MITFCIYRAFLFFADVSIQIGAVSSTDGATDHKHIFSFYVSDIKQYLKV